MKTSLSWSLFNKRSILLILVLGFSSGLPLSLSVSTLQAWFTVSHISVTTIGWLTLLGLPYTYKFIWAALLDRYYMPSLGRRRSWLLLTQVSLLGFIVFLSYLQPLQDMQLICVTALLISFISATQDIAVDAYRTEILTEQEQGVGAAVFVMGYRLGMLVSGGLALVIADKFGWQATFLGLAALMLLGVTATYFATEPLSRRSPPIKTLSLSKTLITPLVDFWQRSHAMKILCFIVLYKIGEAFAVSLGSNFLLQGLGFSLSDVGIIYKTIGLLATLLGAYIGGVVLNYINLYRSLFFFGILQALAILLFIALAAIGKNYPLMMSVIFAENFTSGMATCALMVLLMRLCNQQYTAAQYALLAAFSAIGRVFVGPLAGFIAYNYSWVSFFMMGFIMTLPGLILLYHLRTKLVDELR